MKRMKFVSLALFCLFINIAVFTQEKMIYQSDAYTVYDNKIIQGKYTAEATSAFSLQSDYQSPPNKYKSSFISFKFAINGEDNEMLSGIDHYYIMPENVSYAETPLILFGEQLKIGEEERIGYIQPGAKLKLKLDMREVLKQFADKGFYQNFSGEKIRKENFEGVYVAGGTAPLTWDFSNLKKYDNLKLHDDDNDGIYEIILDINSNGEELFKEKIRNIQKNLSEYPKLTTDKTLVQVMYHLSLEEMLHAIEPDSTLRTGKEWAGVWTRDVSYSILLSMAHLQPEVSKISLRKKINKKKQIIQDTGTGGAWPVSTDRVVWAVAAWEIYKVTGDLDWLKEAYEVIKNTLETDRLNIYDEATGLFKGESSFLDWREQTYAEWMEPSDIFESLNLGTNAVHFKAYEVAAEMAAILKEKKEAKKYKNFAISIKNAINKHLWQEEKGYYAQYLYGRNFLIQSSRSEALGNSLAVIFGIADEQQAKNIASKMPVTDYGIPCIFPQIPDIPPYHNNGIWPFVQAYWMHASAKAGNQQGVLESIAALYRQAGMFLTNQENFVAENGDYAGTQINSANMLWSLSGNLSIIYKTIFGISFEKNTLAFKPLIPASMQGKYQLNSFRYRNSVLNITVEGFGDTISEFYVNGTLRLKHEISAEEKGNIDIRIVMNNSFKESGIINKKGLLFSPPAPKIELKGNEISWKKIPDTEKFLLLRNGKIIKELKEHSYTVNDKAFSEYQVIAVDKNGLQSFASEPVLFYEKSYKFEAENEFNQSGFSAAGYSGNGFVETNVNFNTEILFRSNIEETGEYLIRVRYANGNGSVKTDNKCAVRKLTVNNKGEAVFVFPQRGKEEWDNWGWSNGITVSLKKGANNFKLIYNTHHDNMNINTNHALIDYIEIIKR